MKNKAVVLGRLVDAVITALLVVAVSVLASCSGDDSPAAAGNDAGIATTPETASESQPNYTLTARLTNGSEHTVSVPWSEEGKGKQEAIDRVIGFAVTEPLASDAAVEDIGEIRCVFTSRRDAEEVDREIQQSDPSVSSESVWSYTSSFRVYVTTSGGDDHAFAVVGTQDGEDTAPFFYKEFDDIGQASELMVQAVHFGMALDDQFYESLFSDLAVE